MRLIPCMLAAIILCLSPKALPAEEDAKKLSLDNTFFAFDNGPGFGKLPLEERMQTLKDLGYAGVGHTGSGNIPETLKALDKVGLEMNSIYVWCKISPEGPKIDPGLEKAIEQLKGRNTVVWLIVLGKAEGIDDARGQAAKVVGDIGKMAKAGGLQVVLYPHLHFYVDTAEDALQVAKDVDMDNVGVSINLCHRLKIDGEENMEETIKNAMPYLRMVSINGADGGDTKAMGWNKLIQRLDRGSYDTYGFVKTLLKHGYKGPIGLQCYNVAGDPKENLAGSMDAWKKFAKKIAAE